jgi:hypothetical protein
LLRKPNEAEVPIESCRLRILRIDNHQCHTDLFRNLNHAAHCIDQEQTSGVLRFAPRTLDEYCPPAGAKLPGAQAA